MLKIYSILFCLFTLLIPHHLLAQASAPRSHGSFLLPDDFGKILDFQSNQAVPQDPTFKLRYYFYAPYNPKKDDYNPKRGERKLRLLVAIHGSSTLCTELPYDCTNNSDCPLNRADAYIRTSTVWSGDLALSTAAKNGVAILAPAFCGGYSNKEHADALARIIKDIQKRYNFLDSSKEVLIWGHSQGGEFVQTFLKYHSNIVSRASLSASGAYNTGEELSDALRNKSTEVVIGTTDCRCTDGTCFMKNSNTVPLWNQTCDQNGYIDNKWRRIRRAQKFICCEAAKVCSPTDINRVTKMLPPWYPDGASASCDQYYKGSKYPYRETCDKPPASSQSCPNLEFDWTANSFGSVGHDGLTNFTDHVESFLFRDLDRRGLGLNEEFQPITTGERNPASLQSELKLQPFSQEYANGTAHILDRSISVPPDNFIRLSNQSSQPKSYVLYRWVDVEPGVTYNASGVMISNINSSGGSCRLDVYRSFHYPNGSVSVKLEKNIAYATQSFSRYYEYRGRFTAPEKGPDGKNRIMIRMHAFKADCGFDNLKIERASSAKTPAVNTVSLSTEFKSCRTKGLSYESCLNLADSQCKQQSGALIMDATQYPACVIGEFPGF